MFLCLCLTSDTNKRKGMTGNKQEIVLEYGDKTLIAKGLNCFHKSVEYVLKGVRNTRNTPLQENIRKASEFRARQNQELIEYCRQLQVEDVTLS